MAGLTWAWIGGWSSWYWSDGVLALGPLRIFRRGSNQERDPAKGRTLKDEQFEHDYRMGTTPDE